jgi:hypothetical protein
MARRRRVVRRAASPTNPNVARVVRTLERARDRYGGDASRAKLELLTAVARTRFHTSEQVLRVHEALCFLRAYPDDAPVLAAVESALAGWGARHDVRRWKRDLADTGIAGTDIRYRFFWFTARWLAERWPEHLEIEWPEFSNRAELVGLLRLLMPAAESAALDEIEQPARRWIERWRGPGETDAAFLIRRFAALRADAFTIEAMYERLDPPVVLRGAAGGDVRGAALAARGGASTSRAPRPQIAVPPSRTHAHAAGFPVVYRTRPFDRRRPDLRQALRLAPRGIRACGAGEAARLLDLAREAMVTRSRDLDSFEHADAGDTRVVDCGDGLQFACFGLVPERRALLDAIYGFLTLQSGVPTGYVLSSALFESAFVAFNVFETFRGAAAAETYARVLGMVHALFGATTFVIDPYQLGHDNEEGQRSGAWWFYAKLGFEPVDAGVRALVRRERARLRADPEYRSSRSTLQALAAASLFLHARKPRSDVLGQLRLAPVSLHISRFLAARAGGDREAAIAVSVQDAARVLGVRAPRTTDAGRRVAWERWAPLVLVLPDVARWPAAERDALARIIDAKGGQCESDFVRLFDSHRRLRRAVVALSRRTP